MATKEQINNFTGVRGLAAVVVVLVHVNVIMFAMWPGLWQYRRFLWSGNLAVDIFFILSGFVIMYNYGDRLGRRGTRTRKAWKQFVLLRMARMWPVHLFAIGLYIVWYLTRSIHPGAFFPNLLVVPHDQALPVLLAPWNLIMNGLMLNAVWPAQSISTPAWSVSLEFFAYLVFPLVATIAIRFRRSWTAFLAAAVWVGLGATFVGLTNNAPIDDISHAEYLYRAYELPWARIVYTFPTGALLCIGWRQLSDRWRTGKHWDAIIIVSLITMFTIIGFTPQEQVIYMPPTAIPLSAIIILGCAGATGPIAKVLQWRPIEWTGEVSYSLYQTHFIALMAMELLFVTPFLLASPKIVQVWCLIAFFLATFALAWFSFNFVEEPFRKLGRKWIFRPRNPVPLRKRLWRRLRHPITSWKSRSFGRRKGGKRRAGEETPVEPPVEGVPTTPEREPASV